MLLTMRRQNELIVGSQQHPSATSSASSSAGATSSPGLSGQNLNLVAGAGAATNSTSANSQDSLNTPTTPLLGLSRNPLQFAPPPAPPIAVPSPAASGPTFGYYQTANAAPPLHHSPAATSEVSNAPQPPVELDEYVDILQVQQLLLDSSAAAAAAANNPPTTEQSVQQPQQNTVVQPHPHQHQQQQQQPQQQPQQQQQQPQQILAKPRPRINLQKATEYAAQLAQGKDSHPHALYIASQISDHYCNIPIYLYLTPPAESSSPGSRRVLLDYPSPYLYGNPYHHHTPPGEDLVALWFGSNGTGESSPHVARIALHCTYSFGK